MSIISGLKIWYIKSNKGVTLEKWKWTRLSKALNTRVKSVHLAERVANESFLVAERHNWSSTSEMQYVRICAMIGRG